ncbi:succinate dehydrogenase/fumarate reductase iron-sulfur subunit [Cytobacillus dafuensis]|uniref:Fumarate reductase iron-sulfur subunit n=1 Tax=Cytobacillus dafuensis TaxID=1742359 RepID=A0A5B8ZD04_CYTDA|nr:succinate dehydrogenase/fumarate reductase iron-sulfur subunit [Cytobacillus dafuensis]QED49426.1 succinate dehydrogenase/fumarate reductase iron-sulfur subunit [Cytobacillus dafuensis]
MRTIHYKIKRFDGNREWYQDYQLQYEKGKTILWALTTIREQLDPTLVFTSACRHAICGSCAIKVNGKSFLTCKTSLDDVLATFQTDNLVFEPLSNFEVIKDLAIAWEPKMEKMKQVKPWLIPSSEGNVEKGFTQSEDAFHKISSPTDCILCGVCASECNQLAVNDGTFLEPFILNRAYRFAVDSRDCAPNEHILPAYENELWKCLHCMQCISSCPKGIPLTDQIAFLRQESIKLGETNNQGAKHAFAFHDDVRNKGRLNETMLPIKTDGLIKTATTKVPFALRMIRKGKINPFHMPKAVEGIRGVKEIYKYAEEVKNS